MPTASESKATSIPQQGEYNAANIKVLKGLDGVRKRPGMYVGSTDSRGYQHLLWEIVDNAVDEAMAGHCSKINIFLRSDGSAEVHDNGRGIPVDINPEEGISGLELIFTELHAGGKFGGGGYDVAGGLHGVGASVVNALSLKLEAEVDRGSKTHAVTFSKGVSGSFSAKGAFTPAVGLRITGKVPAGQTGTRVRFWPDPEIFLKGSVFDAEAARMRARQTAFLVPGLEITVHDETGEQPAMESFLFEGGLKDMVEYHSPDRPICDPIVITGTGTFKETVPMFNEDGDLVNTEVERSMDVQVALRWGTEYESNVRSFVNIITTPENGTHVTGFERALNKGVNDAIKTMRVAKAGDDPVIKDDIQEGLTAVVLVRFPEPQFESQTKSKLGTPDATRIVNQVVTNGLKEAFSDPKMKAQVKSVLEKINQAGRTRKMARTAKETIRRKNALESASMPAKLKDCHSDEMEKTEFFIIEGDSAAGTVQKARDSQHQAYMPIRGKILNTWRAKESDMLKNPECAGIITAMGGGSGRSFDLSSIRYGKFIILADADVDGSHIRCLLLTLCYRYMHPLLAAGRVYAAMPPLFGIEVVGDRKAGKTFVFSEEERDAEIAKLEKAGKKVKQPIMRYKGLGEMSDKELHDTTMDIRQRTLRRVTMEDAQAAESMFELLMGNEVPPRKDYIIENSTLLDLDALDF